VSNLSTVGAAVSMPAPSSVEFSAGRNVQPSATVAGGVPAPPQPAQDTAAAAAAALPKPPGEQELNALVKEMQAKVSGATSDLQFSVDHDSGKQVVKVTDRTSKEVIWQVPSEQALHVSKALDQYRGAFLNRKA
jgi:flagellar protein FlaG